MNAAACRALVKTDSMQHDNQAPSPSPPCKGLSISVGPMHQEAAVALGAEQMHPSCSASSNRLLNRHLANATTSCCSPAVAIA